MRFILTGIRTTLELRLRSLRGWLPVLLIPVVVLLVLGALPGREMAAPVQVGVALPATGGEEFARLLENRSGTVLTFVFCEVDTIDKNVAAGLWDCGLILPEDFSARLEALDFRRLITIRTAQGSVVYPLVRETVSACLAQLVSPEIAWEYLEEKGMTGSGEDAAAVRQRLEQVLDESDRVIVTMVTADGEPLEPLQLADNGISGVIYWLISALILVWLLLSATETARWLHSGSAIRLHPMQPLTAGALTQLGADGVLAVISGVVAMAFLGAEAAAWAAVVGYAAFWMAAGLLLSRLQGISGVIPVILPFTVVISLLSSGVLADPGLFSSALGRICVCLPVWLFQLGCGGSIGASLGLLGTAAALLALSFGLDMRKKS